MKGGTSTWKRKTDAQGRESWIQLGVDWDNAKPITVWHKTKEHVVFKVPGGKHWASILEPSVSHPGEYVVCEIEEDQGSVLRVRELFEMPLSTRGRQS